MKPHLDLRFGVWRCRLRGTRIAGFGYTVDAAYADFFRDLRKHWLAMGLPVEGMGS